MKSAYIVALILWGSCLPALGAPKAADAGSDAQENPERSLEATLEATASVGKSSFMLGEPITVQYELKNVGKQTAAVCLQKAAPQPDNRLMQKPNHDLAMVDAIQEKLATGGVVWQLVVTCDGKKDRLDPRADLDSRDHGRVPPAQKTDFVVLAPGESCRRTLSLLDGDYLAWFSMPGLYSVRIEYRNRDSGKEFGLDAWCSPAGAPAVASNRVSFAVEDRPPTAGAVAPTTNSAATPEKQWLSFPFIGTADTSAAEMARRNILETVSAEARKCEKEGRYADGAAKWQEVLDKHWAYPQIAALATLQRAECLLKSGKTSEGTAAIMRMQTEFAKYGDAIFRESQEPISYGLLVGVEEGLGYVAEETGDLAEARAHYEKSLANESAFCERIGGWPEAERKALPSQFLRDVLQDRRERKSIGEQLAKVKKRMEEKKDPEAEKRD